MSKKEVQINGKWYWELEATDQNQAFNPPEPAYMWNYELSNNSKELCFIMGNKNDLHYPFVSSNVRSYKHCALLSSEHEKESRRCTDFELARWLAKGSGFWIDDQGRMKTRLDTVYSERNYTSGNGLTFICTWDGEPMAPTAQNMGLEE